MIMQINVCCQNGYIYLLFIFIDCFSLNLVSIHSLTEAKMASLWRTFHHWLYRIYCHFDNFWFNLRGKIQTDDISASASVISSYEFINSCLFVHGFANALSKCHTLHHARWAGCSSCQGLSGVSAVSMESPLEDCCRGARWDPVIVPAHTLVPWVAAEIISLAGPHKVTRWTPNMAARNRLVA